MVESDDATAKKVEGLKDLVTALETDTQTVRREDLPSKIREAAQEHLKESVLPKAEEAVVENAE